MSTFIYNDEKKEKRRNYYLARRKEILKLQKKKWGHIKISKEHKNKLRVIAIKDGRSMSNYVSRIIDLRHRQVG